MQQCTPATRRFNIRRYPNRKLLIKPSKAAIKRLRERLASETRTLRGGNAMAVIARLNPVIRGSPGLGGLLPDSGVDQDVHRPG